MTAYTDWISNFPLSSNMLIDEHRTLVHQAFDAGRRVGIEAAAEIVTDAIGQGSQIAADIRKLLEDNNG